MGTLQSLHLKKALFGKEIVYHIPAEQYNRKGRCKGPLVGGNLSILYSLTNTSSDIRTNGNILFIEDWMNIFIISTG